KDAFTAACLLAGCVRLAEKDERLSVERRPELADSYAERAVGSLRQAVAKGYKDLEALKKQPDLEPLRSREDFKAVAAALEKGREPPPARPRPDEGNPAARTCAPLRTHAPRRRTLRTNQKAAGACPPPGRTRTGPAPPRRPVCAPGRGLCPCIAD